MNTIEINGKFEVLYLRYSVDERDVAVDIFIGADNEEVLHQIGEEYGQLNYNVRKLEDYEVTKYNGSKYLGLYARLEEFSVTRDLGFTFSHLITGYRE